MDTIRLYGKFLAMHIKRQTQYKASFLMTVVGSFAASCTIFAGLYFMFARFQSVEGFTWRQALLSFAVILMAYALGECFGRGFDRFPRYLGNGAFDRMLTRPRGAIFQVLASEAELSRVGTLLQAIVVLIYAVPSCGVVWTADKIVTLVLMIVCGSIVFMGLFVLSAGLAFFTVEGLEVMNIFTDGGREFGRYPFSIYGKGVLRILTFVIPLALFQYYPLLYLLGIETAARYMLAPLVSLLFLAPCYALWRAGLRRYRSTGS